VLIYVDDIVMTSSLDQVITTLLKTSIRILLSDLGDLHLFLGIEVAKTHVVYS
jgi:hypothetical protein